MVVRGQEWDPQQRYVNTSVRGQIDDVKAQFDEDPEEPDEPGAAPEPYAGIAERGVECPKVVEEVQLEEAIHSVHCADGDADEIMEHHLRMMMLADLQP